MADPTLYDHLGRPIRRQELAREHAAPTLMGVRNPWGEGSVAMRLTPDRLASILRAAAEGDTYEYLTLAEEMEERDPHYQSVMGTRKRGCSGLEPTVRAASDDKRDVELADAVREMIAEQEWIPALIEDMLDALGKGYSCCEIMWDRRASSWLPEAPRWRDPRWFVLDLEDGSTLRLRDEQDMMRGVDLAPYKWIVHKPRLKSGLPIRGGLARLAASAFMCKSYSLSDWMRFAEVFGLPLRVGRYGASATERDIATLTSAVANLGSDAAACIPDTMRIEFIEAGKSTGGDTLFLGLAEFWDKQVSKAVLGQTMTTDDGSSMAQAQIHEQVRQDILEADARQVEATLNRDLVRAFIDLNYGPQQQYPRLCVRVPQKEDVASLVNALDKLVPCGLRVQASEVRDKLGLSDPDKQAEVLMPPALLTMQGQDATAQAVQRELRALGFGVARNAAAPVQPVGPQPELDEIQAGALDDWEPIMRPMVDPIQALADECASYEEFQQRLPEVLAAMDPAELARSLATTTFKARGLGDGSK